MSHTLNFFKYHGLGNDFIIINNLEATEPLLKSNEAVKVCNRHFGIGADGVIMVMNGQESCDYTMKIFNSDGSEPQMCGNGIRCFALFLHTLEGATHNNERSYRIWTKGGAIVATVLPNRHVLVNMGSPRLTAASVPSTLTCTVGDKAIDSPLDLLNKSFSVTAVGMGNPHAVVFVDTDPDNLSDPSFEFLGPALENHFTFPEKTNAEFVKVLSRQHLKMRVWERGAGPTLACGTGACAVAVAGVLTGRSDRIVTVTLPGGDLLIEWRESDDYVYMTGPATLAFEGKIALPINLW